MESPAIASLRLLMSPWKNFRVYIEHWSINKAKRLQKQNSLKRAFKDPLHDLRGIMSPPFLSEWKATSHLYAALPPKTGGWGTWGFSISSLQHRWSSWETATSLWSPHVLHDAAEIWTRISLLHFQYSQLHHTGLQPGHLGKNKTTTKMWWFFSCIKKRFRPTARRDYLWVGMRFSKGTRKKTPTTLTYNGVFLYE